MKGWRAIRRVAKNMLNLACWQKSGFGFEGLRFLESSAPHAIKCDETVAVSRQFPMAFNLHDWHPLTLCHPSLVQSQPGPIAPSPIGTDASLRRQAIGQGEHAACNTQEHQGCDAH